MPARKRVSTRQKIKHFVHRAPPASRLESSFEEQLRLCWEHAPGIERRVRVLSAAQRSQIQAVLQANEKLRVSSDGEASRRSNMQYMFDALPHPILVLNEDYPVWNRAFDETLWRERTWQAHFPALLRTAVVKPFIQTLLRIHAQDLSSFYFPLGAQIWAVRVTAVPNSETKVAYFFAAASLPTEVNPKARLMLTLRASGLSLKEIAVVMDISDGHVKYLSKYHRAQFLALKQQIGR